MCPGMSFSRSCIFQLLLDSGPPFSGPANSAPPDDRLDHQDHDHLDGQDHGFRSLATLKLVLSEL